MSKQTYADIRLREPTILDSEQVLEMRKEFLLTNCKFNGTCNLDLFETYIHWFAHTINQARSTDFNNQPHSRKSTYLVVDTNDALIGMVEIIFYYNPQSMQMHAHIIECIRPSIRRQGYGKPLLKIATQECRSFGVLKENITSERNSKASNDTMNKIMDF